MIYLDNAATTRPLKTALDSAVQYNADVFFNPSALYRGGLAAKKYLNEARGKLVSLLQSTMHELIFTSCGSESDNQAIFGCARRGSAVTTSGEHPAVYKSFLELKNRGINVHFAGLERDGRVNAEELLSLVKNSGAKFVSVVHVNNETGAINDINALAKSIKAIDKSIVFHSDGVQAFGKIPYRLSSDVDLYSVSAHKINALKGTGALYKKKSLNLPPLIWGGGQESGLRSGTENLFGIKVFQFAAEEKFANLDKYFEHVKMLKKTFLNRLNPLLFEVISGDNNCSPYILSIFAKGVKGEVIMHMLEEFDVIVGNGSACSSKNRYSRVIEACGYKNNDGVIRISFSPYLEIEEINFAVDRLNECAEKLVKVVNK